LNKPDQREVNRRNEDYITNKVLALFAVAAVFLFGFTSLINNLKGSNADIFIIINKVLICAFAVLTAVCFVQHVKKVKSGGYKEFAVFTWHYFAWVSLAATACLIFINYNYDMASKILYVFIPVGAVLYLIKNSYQAEFSTVCCTHALVAMALWYMYKYPTGYRYNGIGIVLFVIVCLLCAAAVIFAVFSGKTGGKLRIKDYELTPFKGMKRGYIAALYSATLAFVILCSIMGPIWCYYGMFVVCGFILCSAIYYTAKLI